MSNKLKVLETIKNVWNAHTRMCDEQASCDVCIFHAYTSPQCEDIHMRKSLEGDEFYEYLNLSRGFGQQHKYQTFSEYLDWHIKMMQGLYNKVTHTKTINIDNINLSRLQNILSDWHTDDRTGKLVLEFHEDRMLKLKLNVINGDTEECGIEIDLVCEGATKREE